MKSPTLFAIFLMLGIVLNAQKIKIVIPNGMSGLSKLVVDKQERYLYTANDDKVVMWDIKSGKQLHTFKLDGKKFNCMSISNSGEKIAVAIDYKLICFSTVTGDKIFENTKNVSIENSVIFSPNDEEIYVTDEQKLYFLNSETGKETDSFLSKIESRGKNLFFIDDGRTLVVPGFYYSWSLVDLKTKQSKIITVDKKYESLVYKSSVPAKGYIFLAQNGRPGILFDVKTGNLIHVLSEKVYDEDFLPSVDGNELIFCEDNGLLPEKRKIVKFDLNTFKEKGVVKSNINNLTGAYYNSKNGISILYHQEYEEKTTRFGANRLVNFDVFQELIVNNFEGVICEFDGNYWGSVGYNKNLGQLDISADEKTYRRMDIFRMKPIKFWKPYQGIENVLMSSTGDSLVKFDSRAGLDEFISLYKNSENLSNLTSIKTKYNHNFSTFNFFSNDGRFLMYSDNFLIKHNLKTGVKQQVTPMMNFEVSYLNSDKTIFGGATLDKNGGSNFILKNVIDGKVLFKKPIKLLENSFIAVSKNNNRVLTYDDYKFQYYDLQSNGLISESKTIGLERNGSFFSIPIINVGVSSDMELIAGTNTFINDPPGNVALFNKNGQLIREFVAHNSAIIKIYFSPDDKQLYTIGSDGTIKVWDTGNGKLIGTLYLFKETNDYVFVTSDGRFDGTENGIKQLYFTRNREIIPLDKLYEKYYTPNLYQRLLAGEKFEPIPDIENLKPKPKAKILYAEANRDVEDAKPTYASTSGIAEITVSATAPEDKVDEIRLFHNGKAVNLATRGLFVTDADGTDTKKYTINLLPGQNNFRAIALNSQRTESEPDEIVVAYNKSGGNTPTPKPVDNNTVVVDAIDKNATLHIVVVGINAYKGKINPLTYALPDATAFKTELEKDAKSVIGNVKSYLIADDAASKAGIVAAFENIKKTAKPEDVFVFYYAGHGYIHPSNKEFYLVSSDVADGGESLLKNGVSAKELQTFAVDIPAQKQVFIMDACQSAGAFEQMLKHDGEQQKNLAVLARSTGTHWMAASGSTETAKEFGELGHGVFTYSLLEALKGKAVNNKMITVNGLKNYLQIIVPELVKKYGGNSQYPASYGFGNDFPVEIVK